MGMRHCWWPLKPNCKMICVVGRLNSDTATEGWRAARGLGVSSPHSWLKPEQILFHTSWLGQLTYSQLFSRQAFFLNQFKIPVQGL